MNPRWEWRFVWSTHVERITGRLTLVPGCSVFHRNTPPSLPTVFARATRRGPKLAASDFLKLSGLQGSGMKSPKFASKNYCTTLKIAMKIEQKTQKSAISRERMEISQNPQHLSLC